MIATWDNKEGRKSYLLACVEYWQNERIIRGDHNAMLMTKACLLDYQGGLHDPTPWMIMADWLEEEAGYYTGVLRQSIEICFASPPSE